MRTSGKEHPINNMYTKIINKVICFLSFHIALTLGYLNPALNNPAQDMTEV